MAGVIATCTNCALKFSVKDPLNARGPRVPLILVCGHTICEKCLSTAFRQKGEISCLKCSHVSKKDAVNVHQFDELTKDFPLHVYLLGQFSKNHHNHAHHNSGEDSGLRFIPAGAPVKSAFKAGIKYKLKEASVVPKMCDECSATTVAVWACNQCSLNYCNVCYTQVHQFKSTKMHMKTAIVHFTESNDLASGTATQKRSRLCTDHPTQNLEFFCRDCEECVCSYCIVPLDSTHRDHNVVMVQKMTEECVPKLRQAVETGNVVLQNLMNAELALNDKNGPQSSATEVKKQSAGITTLAQQVANHFAWLHAILQQSEANLLNKLALVCDEEYNLRIAIKGQVMQSLTHCKEVLQQADTVLYSRDSETAVNILDIIEDVQMLNDLPCRLMLDQQNGEMNMTVNEGFVAELENHCMLKVPPARGLTLAKIDETIGEGWTVAAVPDYHYPVPQTANGTAFQQPGRLVQPASSRASSVSDGDLSELARATLHSPAPTRGYISPRTQEVVKICHIKDPSYFFVLRIPDAKFLDDLSSQLQKSALKQRQPDANQVKEGQMFLVEYSRDRKWYRGRVRTVRTVDETDGMLEVLYVDHGNFEVVTMKHLKTLPLEFATLPPLAICCTLDKISPRGDCWTPDSIKWFAKVANDVQLLCTVYEVVNGIFSVDIGQAPHDTTEGIPLSIADALIFLEYAQYNDQSSMPSLQVAKPVDKVEAQSCFYEDRDFKKGEKFYVVVSHVDTPHHLYVQRTDEALLKYLVQITDELTEIYTSQSRKPSSTKENKPIYSPKIGMACAAHFAVDGRWYRAKVIALPGKKRVEVLFVDYGNKDTVLYTEIRYLREKHLRIPALALVCSLGDVAPVGEVWSVEATQYLQEATRDKVLEVQVQSNVLSDIMKVGLFENKPTVSISFNSLLVRAGHASSTGDLASTSEFYKSVSPTQAMSPDPRTWTPPTRRAAVVVEPAVSKVKAAPVDAPKDPYRIEVKVMAAVSPSAMLVSIVSYAPFIEKMNDELQVFYAQTSPDAGLQWAIGDKCAVFYESEQKWCRGSISALPKSEEAIVLMRDIAVKALVKFAHLRCLDKRFQQVNDGSISCQLAGIVPAGTTWPGMACEFMQKFLCQQRTVYITKRGEITNNTLPVELYKCEEYTPGPTLPTIQRFTSLNVELVNEGLAIPVRGASDIPSTTSEAVICELENNCKDQLWPDYVPLPRPEASTSETGDSSDSESDEEKLPEEVYGKKQSSLDWLPVTEIDTDCFEASPTYVDSEGFIYIHDHLEASEQVQLLQAKLQSKFENAASKPIDWDWAAGEICVAKYHLDNNWYRARTLYPDVNGDWKVIFVDYGNEEVCSPREMRKTDFMWDIPIQCHKCILENVRPKARDGRWTTESLDFLHSAVVDHKCTVYLKSPVGSPDPIKIQLVRYDGINISNFLVDHNYARHVVVGSSDARPPVQAALALHNKIAGKKLVAKPSKKRRDSSSKCASDMIFGSNVKDFEYCSRSVSTEQPNEVELSSSSSSHSLLSSNKRAPFSHNSWAASGGTRMDTIAKKKLSNSVELLRDLAESETSSGATTPDIETSVEDLTAGDAILKAEVVDNLASNYSTGKIVLSEFYEKVLLMNKDNIESCSFDAAENSDVTRETEPYVYYDLPDVSQIHIMVRSVQTPTDLMVYVLTENSSQKLQHLNDLELILSADAPQQPQLLNPSPGMPCVASFKRNKSKWQRGKVIEVDSADGLVTVLSVDNGKTETLPLDRVVETKHKWTMLPATLHPCKLWNISASKGCSLEDIIENMSLILIDQPLVANIKASKPVLTVDILSGDQQALMYQSLIDAGLLFKTDD